MISSNDSEAAEFLGVVLGNVTVFPNAQVVLLGQRLGLLIVIDLQSK